MVSVGKNQCRCFGESKNLTWTSFKITWEVGKWVGGRDKIRLVLSLYLLKLTDGYMGFLYSSLLLHMFECFHSKQIFKILRFNYFPAGVYTLNMEVIMFIVYLYNRLCISYNILFPTNLYFHIFLEQTHKIS